MKTLINFSAIAFLLIIGVSCSSSDDDFQPPANTTPSVSNTPEVNTPAVNTPVVNTPVATITDSAPTDVIITFKADLKPDGVTTITYATPIGNITLLLNQTTKTFKLTDAGADNFNPNYINIHTEEGKILFIIPNNIFLSNSSPTYSLNDGQIMELTANHYYVNFSGPDGDINGQLIQQ